MDVSGIAGGGIIRPHSGEAVQGRTLHLHTGRATKLPEIIEHYVLNSFEVFRCIVILSVGGAHIQLVVRTEIFVILIHGYFYSESQHNEFQAAQNKDSPGPNSTPAARPVSYAQARLTLRIVYPPPPRRSKGRFSDFTNLTQFAWPQLMFSIWPPCGEVTHLSWKD